MKIVYGIFAVVGWAWCVALVVYVLISVRRGRRTGKFK